MRFAAWLVDTWRSWRGWRTITLVGGGGDGAHVLLAPREPAPQRLFWAHRRSHDGPCPASVASLVYAHCSAKGESAEHYRFRCAVDAYGVEIK